MRETPSANAVGRSAYVMIRIYQLSDEERDFVRRITYATNSQNPVDLRDLRSNDEIQKNLEIAMQGLGYTYRRQREEGNGGPHFITSLTAAEAVLAVWRQKPHQSKFRRREHFGKLYGEIFNNLNAAQTILAVLIFRHAENERKRPSMAKPPEFLPYSSHYIAMLIGMYLLNEQGMSLEEISTRNFTELAERLQEHQGAYYAWALSAIKKAIDECYGKRKISAQQLSATFRRGDLLSFVV